MKLEIGMYIRNHLGRIEKIKSIEPYNEKYCINGHEFSNNVIKASHNILELIEVGDYINGDKVMGTNNLKLKNKDLLLGVKYLGKQNYIYYTKDFTAKDLIDLDERLSSAEIDFFEGFETPECLLEEGMYKHFFIPVERNIETILTKESFENNCYKVGDYK